MGGRKSRNPGTRFPIALMWADRLWCAWPQRPKKHLLQSPTPCNNLEKALLFSRRRQASISKQLLSPPSFPSNLDAQKLLPGYQNINQVWIEGKGGDSPPPLCFASP